MARDLGELGGAPRVIEDITFQWYGEPIRVNPELGEDSYMDFLNRATEINMPGDIDDITPEDAAKVKDALPMLNDWVAACIHPADMDAFERICKREKKGLKSKMELSMKLLEEVTEVPTEEPATSSRGQRRTAKKSVDGSPSKAANRVRKLGTTRTDRVIAIQEKRGRGDLAVSLRLRQLEEAAVSA